MKEFGFKKLMIFIVLSAAVALAYQLPYIRFTFYDEVLEAWRITDTQMGFIASAMGLTCTVCYPIGGLIANRFTTRSLMLITLAAFTVLCALNAFVTNFYGLVIIHCAYGFFGIATLWSAYLSGIRNLGSEHIQAKLFGFSEATRGLIQTAMGFVFLAIFGAVSTPIFGIRYSLLCGSVVFALFFMLGFIFLPKGVKQEKSAVKPEKKYTYLDVIKNKGTWLVILLIMSAFTSWLLGNNYMTTYTTRVLGISNALASTLGIIRTYIIVALAGFLGGWVLDKFTYKGKGFIVLFAILAALIAGVVFSHKIVGLCVGITLVFAFFVNVMKSTYWSTMNSAGIPASMTPLATGFISLIVFLPETICPLFCGPWLDAAAAAGNVAVGFNKIFLLMFVFALIGIVASFFLIKQAKALEKEDKMDIEEA
ncbi:MAG: MFS transporter [Lachnospiraceae bacterium]|nr:MFS transporter [Lachnospiraceae bacterium]